MSQPTKHCFVLFVTITITFGPSTHAQLGVSPRKQLEQYVAQLKANPSDDALRTRIIQLSLTLDPKPADPPDLLETIGAATYAFKNAQINSGMKEAADLYAKAALEAPWRADLYYNEALALEKARLFDEAIKAYQFYLLAAPNAHDADAVRENIGALKYQISRKLQQQAQQEAEQRAQQDRAQEEARLNTVVGRWMFRDVFMGKALVISRIGNNYSAHLECDDGCETNSLEGFRVDGARVEFRIQYAFRRAWQTSVCSLDADETAPALVGTCTITGNTDTIQGTKEIRGVQLHKQ